LNLLNPAPRSGAPRRSPALSLIFS
jgi:hypothetical protein